MILLFKPVWLKGLNYACIKTKFKYCSLWSWILLLLMFPFDNSKHNFKTKVIALNGNLIFLLYFFITVDNSGVRLIGPNGLLELEGRRSPRTSPQQTLLQGILNHHPGASPLLSSLQGGPNGILGPHRLPPYTSTSTGQYKISSFSISYIRNKNANTSFFNIGFDPLWMWE